MLHGEERTISIQLRDTGLRSADVAFLLFLKRREECGGTIYQWAKVLVQLRKDVKKIFEELDETHSARAKEF